MEQHLPVRSAPDILPVTPRWPEHVNALALDSWLTRVSACGRQEPSVELFMTQYPGEITEEQPAIEARPDEGFQLPLHLQWGEIPVPTNWCELALRPDDAEALRRILATAVNIFAGRTALFALYDRLEAKTYAAMATRLSNGVSLPAIGFDGWILPRSGVAFVWVLENEPH